MFVDHSRPVDFGSLFGVTAAQAAANMARALGVPLPLFEVYGYCPACRVFRCHLLGAPDGDELPRECLNCGHTWTERLEMRNSRG